MAACVIYSNGAGRGNINVMKRVDSSFISACKC